MPDADRNRIGPAESVSRFFRDQQGSVAIEYVLIATMVSIFIIVGVAAYTGTLGDIFNSLPDHFGD